MLEQYAYLYYYSAYALKQQLADRHPAPLGHITQIPSQPVFLLNVACLADNQQISIL